MGDDVRALLRRFEDATQSSDVAELGRMMEDLEADDYVEEYPQSGERISREASRKITDMYSGATGTNPQMKIRRTLVAEDFYVVEGTIDYGDGIPVSYIGIGEVRDGKIARLTSYFANPFEAPAWRAGLVDKMEPTPA